MTSYTRREFTKLALAAIPAAGLVSVLNSSRAAEPKPGGKVNSKIKGVQIGLNVPYSFGSSVMGGDEVLAKCVELGVNGLELRTQTVELFLGAPANVLGRGRSGNPEGLRAWRTQADPKRALEFRKKYEDAGMLIEIVKVDNLFNLNDAEIDYIFLLGKTLGAKALSTERATKDEDYTRIAQFTDKHQLMLGIHGHTDVSPETWEKAIAHSKFIGINMDIGHFIAGNNYSPIDYIKKRHDRITHIHIKDRKLHDGPNTPFGQGDTPIVECLRLMRDGKWTMQATIEFEYDVPEGSTRMAEIAKCVKFCRDALA